MKNKIETLEKNTDLKSLLKNFIKGEQPQDIDEHEVILNDEQLTEQEKNILITSLNRGDKLASRLFKEGLKEDNKKASSAKLKNVKVETEGKVSEKKKKVNKKEKEEKIQEI